MLCFEVVTGYIRPLSGSRTFFKMRGRGMNCIALGSEVSFRLGCTWYVGYVGVWSPAVVFSGVAWIQFGLMVEIRNSSRGRLASGVKNLFYRRTGIFRRGCCACMGCIEDRWVGFFCG